MLNEPIGLRGTKGESPVLREVAVDVRLRGLIQETRIAQTFRNDSNTHIEAVYTFPLPTDAVLLDMELTLGTHLYRGTVVGRKQAEAQYEDAIEQGDSAFRLQKVGDGLYSASVGNLQAGESAVIRYRYAMTLRWQGNDLMLRVPTTVAPRYGEADRLQPYQRPGASLQAEYALELSVTVHGDLARAAFSCPTHQVSMTPGEDSLSVALVKGARLDRDFILILTASAQQPSCVLAPDGDGYVTLLSCAPAAASEDPAPRSIVLVIDCSGSMAGDSIRQAKDALHLILGRLRIGDTFNVLAFGSQQKVFAARTVPVATHAAAAHAFIDRLNADLGGTELAAALAGAIGMQVEAPACDILLVTDGEVWLRDELFERIRASCRRIFTVGVGSAVAEDVVRRLAARSGGACELVTPKDDMAQRIVRHFARIYQRRLTDIRVVWPGEPPRWEISTGDALFAGDTWSSFASFATAPKGMACIEVDIEGDGCRTFEAVLPTVQASGLSADTLPRLAAATRLEKLPAEEATLLALAYQLVTASTDYLIVVQRQEGEKAEGMPKLHVVDHMLAAGWGGSGTVSLEMPAVMRLGARSLSRDSAPAASIDCCSSVRSPNDWEGSFDLPLLENSAPHPPALSPQTFFYAIIETGTRRKGLLSAKRVFQVPTSLRELPLDGAPAELAARLKELVAAGHPENAVVLALLTVLRDAFGVVLPEDVKRALDQAMQALKPDTRLQRRIEAALRSVANPAWQPKADDASEANAAVTSVRDV